MTVANQTHASESGDLALSERQTALVESLLDESDGLRLFLQQNTLAKLGAFFVNHRHVTNPKSRLHVRAIYNVQAEPKRFLDSRKSLPLIYR